MVIPFSAPEEIANHETLHLHSVGNNKDRANDIEKFELINLLQSSLELETLLNYFLTDLRKTVPVDGICFTDEAREQAIKLGKQSTHSCGYRLNSSGSDCGELIFKRDSRFSETELQDIEQRIVLLLAPVNNALKYADAVACADRKVIEQIANWENLKTALHREIELAKRHNYSLDVISLIVQARENPETVSPSLSDLDNFVELLFQHKDVASLIYRVSNQEFLVITSNQSDTIPQAMEWASRRNTFASNEVEKPTLELKIGIATVSGTDSVKSVMDRARKNATVGVHG